MKAQQFKWVLVGVFFSTGLAAGLTIFDTDGIIEAGDYYSSVGIYGNAVVEMTGGEVDSLFVYELGVLNLHDGIVWSLGAMGNSIVNINGGTIHYGFQGWSDTSEINIFGYDFDTYIENQRIYLSGKWESGQEFNFYFFRSLELPANLTLHTIPEPLSIVLFAIGGCLLRKIH